MSSHCQQAPAAFAVDIVVGLLTRTFRLDFSVYCLGLRGSVARSGRRLAGSKTTAATVNA